MTFTLDKAREMLRSQWGYKEFRPSQREAMVCIGEGDDVLAVLPTGVGKSMLYQLPALLSEGGTIVVSPLIALMKDQVDQAVARGIPAACINSTMDEDDQWDAIEGFVGGSNKLLYISPERIGSRSFISAIQRADVSIVAIDEAHSCSQWGHQFRPDYMHIHRLIRALSDGETQPQVLAMTATATPIVVKDVVEALGLKREEVTVLVADPIRSNLRYEVRDGGIDGYGNPWGIFRRIVEDMDVEDGRHLVYCFSRNGSEKLASICEEALCLDGVAVAYHAGLTGTVRNEIQEEFSNEKGRVRIVAATTAFGMGVDVPDIRTVVLFGFPGSLEDYTQQIGRAGRDGAVARTILIADQTSADFQMKLIENENPPWQHYQLMWEWLHERLQPGETLRATRSDISQEITARRVEALSPDQVGVILNRLHATGLIERRAIEEGIPITVDVSALRRSIEDPGKAKPQIVHMWRTFLASCVEPELKKQEVKNPLVVWINKTSLREQAGLTVYYVTKALESLQKRDAVLDIGTAVSGVIVKVLKWRADLTKELPVDRIEEKRVRDFARFHKLLDYTRLPSEEERKAMLRDYFLSSVDSD